MGINELTDELSHYIKPLWADPSFTVLQKLIMSCCKSSFSDALDKIKLHTLRPDCRALSKIEKLWNLKEIFSGQVWCREARQDMTEEEQGRNYRQKAAEYMISSDDKLE